ncbi:MAG: gamma-glutamyl-gamma-aminobutyrate hydrolase family protein [Armatimonadetes bacterium]|nr:gamma-glutamyl-gamma-aminobutyrate hydrolase family protein [Armatimonadota bacterium]
MPQPRIVIVWTAPDERYENALTAAGVTLEAVTREADETCLEQALKRADGLVLAGGPDIDPKLYGAERSEHVTDEHIDPRRDLLDAIAVRYALANPDLPVLGICRGIQAFNVFAGGDLIQHIPAEVPSPHEAHLALPDKGEEHPIHLTGPDSLLAQIIGAEEAVVNSFHHQAVKTPAAGLIVTAEACDGVIEAMERPSARWTLLVQWHPERMVDRDAWARRLFAAFVAACAS